MTQNTLITRIEKTFGKNNISKITKWQGLIHSKQFPTVSFTYKNNDFVAEGTPKQLPELKKDLYEVFRYYGLSKVPDKWMTEKLDGFNINDVKTITKKIRNTATKLPKKKLRLEDVVNA